MNLTWKTIMELSCELRKNPTKAEKHLWKELRRRQLHGYKFLWQKPFLYEQCEHVRYFYIVDFYCAELNLMIELDGKIHDFQKEYDYQQDVVIKGLGLKMLRIRNEELMDTDSVINKIENFMER